jgi:hypothetical protein
MIGLKVKDKLGRKVVAKMAVVGFAAIVLNPKSTNKKHAEGVGAEDM